MKAPKLVALSAAIVLGCAGCGMIGGDGSDGGTDHHDGGAAAAPEFNVNAEAYQDSYDGTYYFSTPDKTVNCAVSKQSADSTLRCNVPFAQPPYFTSTTAVQAVENMAHGAGFVPTTDEANSADDNARPLLAGNAIKAYDFTCATPEDSVMECWRADEHFRFAQGTLDSNDWTEGVPRKDAVPDGGLCGWADVQGTALPIVVRANGLGTMQCKDARDMVSQLVAAGFDDDSKLDNDYFGDMSCDVSDPQGTSSDPIVSCDYSGGNTDSNVGFRVYSVRPR